VLTAAISIEKLRASFVEGARFTPSTTPLSIGGLAMFRSPRILIRFSVARSLAITSLSLALSAACSAPTGPKEHLLLLDGDGNPHDPEHVESQFLFEKGYPPFSTDDFKAYLDDLESKLIGYASVDAAHRRVVIFVNGGLDDMPMITGRAAKLSPIIAADGADKAFPIFVGWDTGVFHSLGNHFFVVRRGYKNPWLAVPTFPFVLAEDLLRGIVHLPQDVFYYNVQTFWQGRYRYRSPSIHSSQMVVDSIACTEPEQNEQPHTGPRSDSPPAVPGDRMQLLADPDTPLPDTWPMYFVRYFVEMPIQIPQHVFIDGLGTAAWDEMDRRARVLFEGVEDESVQSPDSESSTALAQLLGRLGDVQRKLKKEGIALKVDLVCHSMGAIVGNRILRLASRVNPDAVDSKKHEIPPLFDDIVYMGAACTITDYESAVFPYLASSTHASTNFYHLTLQERAENAESTAWGIIPFGSLLCWIDSYYEHSLTPTDRVAGRFTNLMNNYHRTPDRLRPRIHVKAFGTDRADAEHALIHGDFSDLSFWRSSVWSPDASKSWCPTESRPVEAPARAKATGQ
jgi:hypothetical protein